MKKTTGVQTKKEGDKVVAISMERYRATAAQKRRHGGGTITVFSVSFARDQNDPNKRMQIEGFGKTPGERKTYAIKRFLEKQEGKVS